MEGFILALYLYVSLFCFLLLRVSAYYLSLLSLHKLHQVCSLLRCHLFVVYLFEPVISKDDHLVTVFRDLGHGIVSQIESLKGTHCLKHGAHMSFEICDTVPFQNKNF